MQKNTPTASQLNELAKIHRQEEKEFNRQADWLAIFPEAKPVIYEKIQETFSEAESLKKAYEESLRWLYQQQVTEFEQYFFEQIYLYRFAQPIQEYYQHIRKLQGYLDKNNHASFPQTQKESSKLSPELIEQARNVDLVHLFETDHYAVRRSGQNFVTHCPFHDENTPSCYIYANKNRFYCFGCQAHGDSIAYIQKTRNLDFISSINYLQGAI